MSDTPEGVGWWQASDGKWYAPEQAGLGQPTEVASAAPADSGGQGGGGVPPKPSASGAGFLGSLDPRVVMIGIAVVVVIAIVGAIIVISSSDDDGGDEATSIQAPGEVFLQPVDEPGPDAFAEAVEDLTDTMPINFVEPTPTSTPSAEATPDEDETNAAEEDEEATAENGEDEDDEDDEDTEAATDGQGEASTDDPVTTVANSGTTPGLYGGARDNASCNKQAIIDFLAANPDKARAWAAVQGVDPLLIADYINSLTPVVLMADTRVTNHGFRNGSANGFQAVLQRGTAVLVDDKGEPKVRCACGNPLLTPVPQVTNTVYTGHTWDTFSPQTVVVVTPGPAVTVIIIQDTYGGDPFGRPTGTSGTHDEDAPPEIIIIIDRVTQPPTESPPTTTFVDDFGPSTTTFEDDFGPPTTTFEDDFSGGAVLAATEICAAWIEFFSTFLDFYGGDIFADEADLADPAAAHAYFVAAMNDLAELSPTETLREALLVLGTATLSEFEASEDDARFDTAGEVIEAELEPLCPEFAETD
jgi:hypothetical protein